MLTGHDLYAREEDTAVIESMQSLGFRVIDVHPDIILCDSVTGSGAFSIPLYAAQKIVAALDRPQV